MVGKAASSATDPPDVASPVREWRAGRLDGSSDEGGDDGDDGDDILGPCAARREGEMIKGKDDWYGNDLNNFFYISVGGDTYHGGGGIDTINAVTNKSLWISSATKYTKLANGNIYLNVGCCENDQ